MAKGITRVRPPSKPASPRKDHTAEQRPPKDNRIHWVRFQDEWMPAWDLSNVPDEFFPKPVKLFPGKPGRKTNQKRLAEVRGLIDSGWSQRAIARRLGVPYNVIRAFVSRHRLKIPRHT